MASFCKQCAEELDFDADYVNLFTENGIEPDPKGQVGFPVLCETCGPLCFIIDNEGTCGSAHCNGSMKDARPHANS